VSGQIVADLQEMTAVAGLLAELIDRVGAATAACADASHDVRLAATAALDPLPTARLEWDLLDARDGPGGLRLAAVELAVLRAALRFAVGAYVEADHALDGAQLWLVDHPSVVDDAIHALTAVTGTSERTLAGLLGTLYPDGRPQVRRVAVSDGDPPPHSVGDVLAGLARRSQLSDRWSGAPAGAVDALPAGFDDGTIDVRRLSGPSGTAWLVDLPGTSRWDLPGPWADPHREHDPADFGGDVRLMAGESTAYERGVVDAVRSLPVRPGQPVLLAGHSEGGMVAMAAAGLLVGSGLHVTSVLTAGSPIAGMRPPAGVDVLALENSDDIVPRLDGAANPAEPGWATVRFTDQRGAVAADHGYAAYSVGAALADRSSDPAVRRWLAGAAPFLTATSCRTWAFRIQRRP
jgi:hypothetical protein